MKRINIYVTDRQYLFLQLSGGMAETVRTALDELIAKTKKQDFATSQSQGGVNSGR